MGTRLVRLAIAALVPVLLGGLQASAQQTEPPLQTTDSFAPIPQGRGDATPNPSYRLRSGDVVELNFPFVPTFNQTLTVEPDGYVTLQAVGPFHVAGLTVPELMQALRGEYASVLRDPVVTAQLKDFQRPYFIVAGDVEHPGKYELRANTTVTEAVAIAGGVQDRAKVSHAVVFHRLPGGEVQTATLDLKQTMKQALQNGDPRLTPGDMLFIPHGSDFKVTDWLPALWILGIFY